MQRKYFLLLIIVCAVSCSPAKINQYVKEDKVKKRNGKWIETNVTEQGEYISTGKYKKGVKVGVWRTLVDHQMYQKDVYGKDLIKTKIFYPTGKIKTRGQSTTEVGNDFIHWFYTGDWKYYNELGKLIYIKKYQAGKPSDSISYQN